MIIIIMEITFKDNFAVSPLTVLDEAISIEGLDGLFIFSHSTPLKFIPGKDILVSKGSFD